MPKMKSHRSAAKRFRVTGAGRILRNHAFLGHLRRKKTARRKRRLSLAATVHPADEKRVEALLPYLKR